MTIEFIARVAYRRRGEVLVCSNSRMSRHRALLRIGAASAALLAGTSASMAADVSWINSDTAEMLWEDAANWSPAAPASGDAVTIATGNSGLYTNVSVGTVNVVDGVLWINRNGVLNADTINVSGGRLALSKGDVAAATNPGPQGMANISTLLNITGGTVERFGLIDLGEAGTVTQSGGSVLSPVQIHTPSYVQTGGTIQGEIAYTDTFELAGDGTILWGARLVGDSGAVFEQSGGTMGGTVQFEDGAGVSKYVQTGGDMTGKVITGTYEASDGTIAVHSEVDFSELFALSGDARLGDIYLNGDGDAAMTQSGGTMGAWVSGIETYTMTGGTILAATEVLTDAFVQTGGSISDPGEDGWRAHVGFATRYELSGDASIGLANLVGDADATMTQSGGTMGGHVYSHTPTETIAQYTQTGGDMTGWVISRTYEASGGNVLGTVNFSELFALSGDAVVGEAAVLTGDGDAAMTQSGGTMAGEVRGVATYTLSGGTIGGTVYYNDHFELSGTGEIGFVDIYGSTDATMTQSGGTMEGWVHAADGDGFIEKYTQTGGDMNRYVTARNYEMSGGTINDWVEFTELFDFSDGAVLGNGYLHGWDSGSITQSGGTMGGLAVDIVSYDQSGGAMTNYVATAGYALSGGSVSGHVNFTDRFELSGSGEVDADGTLSGDNDAVMIQSGGLMNGHVNAITTYTQTGGTMAGKVDTVEYVQAGGTLGGIVNAQTTYSLSAGSLVGTVNFGTTATLTGTGEVTSDGQLNGDGSATMAQTGGTMSGAITGTTGYTQSGGAMDGMVDAQEYVQAGGTLSGIVNAQTTYSLSAGSLIGTVNFGTMATLSGTGEVTSDGQLKGDGSATIAQTGGAMNGTVTGITGYTQSGGAMGGTVTTGSYALSGGVLSGDVTFSTLFALSGASAVTTGASLTQTGGGMGSTVSGLASYTQSGGAMTGRVEALSYDHSGGSVAGTIDAATYTVNNATAVSSGTITASDAFNLGFGTGTGTVAAKLSGTGNVVKSGSSTVVLANDANDFSGTVSVDGGVLEVKDSALPGEASVTVADGAALRFNTGTGVRAAFDGTMTGVSGVLEKTGLGTLTLGGDIYLGALLVNGGVLNIGNGAPEEASFDSARIEEGATLYVASGATLRIRIPKNIANFGRLINDGSVYDDLDNAGWFENNALYVANLASNTHDINNNSRWEGDVLTNNGWIFNNDDATWIGDIVSNAARDPNGRPGRIANAGGTWRGDIFSNAGHIINDNIADESDFGYWFGDIHSNSNWIFNGGGGIWEGDVITNAGYVDNGKPAVWTGDVQSNAFVVSNGGIWNGKVMSNAGTVHNSGGTWNGDVEANTGVIRNIAGVDANGPTGGSTWEGEVVTNAGTILNAADSTWTGDALSNSGTIRTLGLWTGDFTNEGTVEAQNQIVGSFTNSGTLKLTGDLSGITTLTNTGTLDMLADGPHVLTVANASFASGSFLDVQVGANGTSDRIAVTGQATLGGTVRVSSGGVPHGSGPFDIITADSFTGAFDDVTTNLAFLTPRLFQGQQSVSVDVMRNDVGFGETGATRNQLATGTVVETFGAGNPIYDAVLWLTPEEAQSAFSELSGEVHESHASVAVENAGMIGQMASSRIDQAFADFGETDDSIVLTSFAEGGSPLVGSSPRRKAVWGQVYGAYRSVDADEGLAGVAASGGGMVVGVDGLLGDWRLGVLLQGGFSDTKLSALDASAKSTDYGAGVYGGRQFGETLLSFGASYTQHDNRTTRHVSFLGFTDTATASYGSGTSQVFANVSHGFDFGAASLTPYAGLSHIRHASDGFAEKGDAAALAGADSTINVTFGSVGLEVEREFALAHDMPITATGSIGWRHAFGGTPISSHRFAAGPAFTVEGVPVTSDLLLLGGGLSVDVGNGSSVDLTYAGQLGSGTQRHELQGTWLKRF